MTGIPPFKQIQDRRVAFSFEGAPALWNTGEPEWCHVVNGASVLMPYLEPFLIHAMREAMTRLEDARLLADARLFNSQEAQHSRVHRQFNEAVRSSANALLEEEERTRSEYIRLRGKSLRWRLAYAVGFETLTQGVLEWLVKDRVALFGGANQEVVSFIMWHLVEEAEHRTVAFDVYQALYGDYLGRVSGLFIAAWHVVRLTRRAYRATMKEDGRWYRPLRRLKLIMHGLRAIYAVSRAAAVAVRPSYNPRHSTLPTWVSEWREAYASLPANGRPILDTAHPNLPARFI